MRDETHISHSLRQSCANCAQAHGCFARLALRPFQCDQAQMRDEMHISPPFGSCTQTVRRRMAVSRGLLYAHFSAIRRRCATKRTSATLSASALKLCAGAGCSARLALRPFQRDQAQMRDEMHISTLPAVVRELCADAACFTAPAFDSPSVHWLMCGRVLRYALSCTLKAWKPLPTSCVSPMNSTRAVAPKGTVTCRCVPPKRFIQRTATSPRTVSTTA